MIKLTDLERSMRGQFIWGDETRKPMATDEEYEGNIEVARTIFVGLSNMYGFEPLDVCDHLEIGYDVFNQKLQTFKDNYRAGVTGQWTGQQAKRMYIKTGLVLNAIKYKTQTNPYIKLEEIL